MSQEQPSNKDKGQKEWNSIGSTNSEVARTPPPRRSASFLLPNILVVLRTTQSPDFNVGVIEGTTEDHGVVYRTALYKDLQALEGKMGTDCSSLQYWQEVGAKVRAAEPYVTSRCRHRAKARERSTALDSCQSAWEMRAVSSEAELHL